jgi:hypothetical protein
MILTYVIICRFALIKCDAEKPGADLLTRMNGKEYKFVDG